MTRTFPFPIGTIHIIGIGGIGMSGYAEILHNLGYAVQGSDMQENAQVQRLRAFGVRIMIGHDANQVKDNDGENCAVVVRSTAVKEDNPEIIAAQSLGIPVIPRVELLAELMRRKWCINISGTHGKTTTTSIVGQVLEEAGLDPTVINGGIIEAYGSNTKLGGGKWLVVESDESDGTFAKLPSVISVITNIDPEHLDYYGDFETLKKTFLSYVENLPFYGVAVACSDHPVVRELLPQFKRKTVTYGTTEDADICATNIRATPGGLVFDVICSSDMINYPDKLPNVLLPMFGRHNVLNALSAFAIGHEIEVPAETVVRGLAALKGVKRRFTTTGIVNGITIIDDYGHHPVEIEAVLHAGREALDGRDGGRLIAVVQPHRYTRLQSLFDEFCACCNEADVVIVSDVYPAGEKPIPDISGDILAEGIRRSGKTDVHKLAKPEALPDLIAGLANPGDFIICLGAGDITKWAHDLPAALEQLARKSGT